MLIDYSPLLRFLGNTILTVPLFKIYNKLQFILLEYYVMDQHKVRCKLLNQMFLGNLQKKKKNWWKQTLHFTLIPTVKHSVGSIMVWGCISSTRQ